MATVVLVFCCTNVASSTSDAALVIFASVRSGAISETAETNVVLPTPKPPEMTTFAETGRVLAVADAIEQPPHNCDVVISCGLEDFKGAFAPEIGHEYTGDAEWHRTLRRNFGD